MRDWQRWHDDYDNPTSELSERLRVVQAEIRRWLDDRPPGPVRVLSLCAGQGHDLVGALRDHPRRTDVSGLLVEFDPGNVAAANVSLNDVGLSRLRAVAADAGVTSSYAEAMPADLVLVCGVFGNVPDDDVRRTAQTLPALCTPGATVIWTRHRRAPDLTPAIRDWFADVGFEEVGFTSPGPDQWTVGVARLTGAPVRLTEPVRLFSFNE